MNKQSTALVAAAACLIGIIFFANHLRTQNESPEFSPEKIEKSVTNSTPAATKNEADRQRVGDREVLPEDPRHAALAEKYGKARTNYAARIASDRTKIWEEQLAMIEITTGGKGVFASTTPVNNVRQHLGDHYGAYEKLALDSDQETKLIDAYVIFQERNKQIIRASIEAKRANPYTDMELMLVGDAFKQGKISSEQFEQTHQASASANEDESFFEMNPMDDPDFKNVMESVLTPSQMEIYEAEKAKYLEELRKMVGGPELKEDDQLQILGNPVMKLEELEEEIANQGKMIAGFKQMAEAASNVPENPQEGSDQSEDISSGN